MTEYIEREERCKNCFHKNACSSWVRHGMALYDDYSFSVEGCLDYVSTADVVEVRHGAWLPYDYDEDEYQDVEESYNWRCSVCQEDISYMDMVERELLPNYCPECGAKMDGKDGAE